MPITTQDAALSNAQQWILSASALLTELQQGNTQLLGGGVPVRDALWARQCLKKNGMSTLDDVHRLLNECLAYIPKTLVLSKGLDDEGNIWIAYKFSALFPPDENDNTAWYRQKVAGWNVMRAANTAGLAFVACWISPERAWEISCSVATFIQRVFTSWQDVFDAGMASLQIGDTDGRAAYARLFAEGGAWTIPWNTDLLSHNKNNLIPRPAEGRTIWQVSANDKINTYSFAAALSQAQAGDCLQMHPGIYVGPWQLHQSIEIIAAESNVLFQAPDDAPATVLAGEGFTWLRNIQIISPGGATRGQVAVACLVGTVLLEHCNIASSGHGLSVAKPAQVFLQHCIIDSCALNGIVVHGVLDANHCLLQNTSYHTLVLDQQAHALLTHCTFKKTGTHTIGIDNGSSARLLDCTIEDATQAAVVVTNQSNIEMIRCKMNHGGVVALNAKRCFFLDCVFNSVPHYSEAQQQIAAFSYVAEIIILQCEFNRATHHAVHLDNAQSVRIESSHFNGGDGNGLIISTSNTPHKFSLKKSFVTTESGDIALMITNSQVELESTQITGGMQSNIVVTENSVLIFNLCKIEQATQTALLISQQSQLFAKGSRINHVGDIAIRLINSMAQLHHCSVHKTQSHGINIEGTSTAHLSHCLIRDAGQSALVIDGTSVVTSDFFQIINSVEDAISLKNGAYLTLISATLNGKTGNKISLNSASTLMFQNCQDITEHRIFIENNHAQCIELLTNN